MFQPSLFGPEGNGLPDPKGVHDLLHEIYPFLWASIVNPFDDLLERRSTDAAFRALDAGEAAQWLRPQIVRRAKAILEDNDAIRHLTIRQQKLWTYKDAVAFSFKKVVLRRPRLGPARLERANYKTKQNVDFWSQRHLEGFPDLPRVLVVYQMLQEMTDVKVHVGLPAIGSCRFSWIYDIPDQDATVRQMEADFNARKADHHDDHDDRGFIVRPRRNVFGTEKKNA